MLPSEAIENQITYLTYLLAETPDTVDPEQLRPTYDGIQHLLEGLRGVLVEPLTSAVGLMRGWLELPMAIPSGRVLQILGILRQVHKYQQKVSPGFA